MTSYLIGYQLECGHIVAGPATLVSGTLWCARDQERYEITDVQVEEWHATCNRCTYGRWAGQSRDTANIFANGHIRHYRGHMVNVNYSANPEAQKTKDKFDRWKVRSQP